MVLVEFIRENELTLLWGLKPRVTGHTSTKMPQTAHQRNQTHSPSNNLPLVNTITHNIWNQIKANQLRLQLQKKIPKLSQHHKLDLTPTPKSKLIASAKTNQRYTSSLSRVNRKPGRNQPPRTKSTTTPKSLSEN
ncbi:hypothetical protein Drorol1_Dr00007947 [Drosera rotundifolia]